MITIIIEERDSDLEITTDMKAILDSLLQEYESTYITAEESLKALNKKQSSQQNLELKL